MFKITLFIFLSFASFTTATGHHSKLSVRCTCINVQSYIGWWWERYEDTPRKIIFPDGIARKKMIFLGRINLHMIIFRKFIQQIVYYTEQHTTIQNSPIFNTFSSLLGDKNVMSVWLSLFISSCYVINSNHIYLN